jgi:hypothetical protein
MQEQTYFNSFILRGTPNGIGGAAVTKMTEWKDETGATVVAKESDAIPIALAATDPGIPLVDVLGQLQVNALATIDSQRKTIEALTAERGALTIAAASTASTIMSLQSELDAIKAAAQAVPEDQTVPDAPASTGMVTWLRGLFS